MKKLVLATALGLVMSGGAIASTVVLDPAKVDPSAPQVTFDEIDFTTINPISYYVDQSEDGFVNTGEFVFDFGSDVQIGFLELNDVIQTDYNLTSGTYSLVADYLLVGEAIVFNQDSAIAAETLTATAEGQGQTLQEYIDDIYSVGGLCDLFPTSTDCGLAAQLNLVDNTLNGDDGEALAANLTDGIFNIFLADDQGDRVGLAGSFDVSGVDINQSDVSLDIFADLVQAEDGILYDEFGFSFADILIDPMKTAPTLTVQSTLQDADNAPGTLTSGAVGTANTAGVTEGGDQLYYYTSSSLGYTAWNITSQTNDCGSSPGGTSFGGCSGLIGQNSPADSLWDDLKWQIRDAAGCSAQDNCQYDLLARTTELDPNGEINVPEPAPLLLFGSVLGLLGLRRKLVK